MAAVNGSGVIPGLKGLNNTSPLSTDLLTKDKGGANAAAFKSALEQASGQFNSASPLNSSKIASTVNAQPLKFSTHAVERMRSRGISFSPDDMKSIENAVSRAAGKGSKDTLVLTDDSALIVSVKNNTVVTVMDRNAMKENVFTNIDSTVMA